MNVPLFISLIQLCSVCLLFEAVYTSREPRCGAVYHDSFCSTGNEGCAFKYVIGLQSSIVFDPFRRSGVGTCRDPYLKVIGVAVVLTKLCVESRYLATRHGIHRGVRCSCRG